jgi:hypothetical protein
VNASLSFGVQAACAIFGVALNSWFDARRRCVNTPAAARADTSRSMAGPPSSNSELAAFKSHANAGAKKADVAEHPKAFHHVGLLINEPPGAAGLLFM